MIQKIGVINGISLDYDVADNIFLSTGIFYARKGYKSDFWDVDDAGNILGKTTIHFKSDNIILPLLLNISTTGSTRIYGSLGAYSGLLFKGKLENGPFLNPPNVNKRLEIGLSYGIGIQTPLLDKTKLDIGFRNDLGLWNADGALNAISFELNLGLKRKF